ncbi:MAG: ABC transporter ATP-binding protein [Alphaproteobacteria bacterium]
MIRIQSLTKSYPTPTGRHVLFKNVNALIPSGINIAILGRNGAGKSTFLRILGGADYPDRGKIVTNKTLSWPVGLSGGFQGSLTGRDNVTFVCRIYGQNKQDTQRKINFIQEFAELGTHFDMAVNTYSSGMRSRLSFGMSMAFDFDYFLIDEVMAVGDANFRKKSQKVFDEKKEKSNMIIVSHNMDVVKENCKKGIVIDKGNFTLYDDITQAIEVYNAL